jgi:hypothetical protein
MKNYFLNKYHSIIIINFRNEDMEHDTLQRRSTATVKNMGNVHFLTYNIK